MIRNIFTTVLLSLALTTLSAATVAPSAPQLPRTLANARFVYVTAYDGDQFDPLLLPDDRAAIGRVEDAIQKWGRLTLVYRRQEADIILVVQSRPSEDVLAVYTQLEQIDSDIEVLKGQIKYTEQSAALSSISVNIIAEETIKPIVVGGWKPQGVARDALQSLIYFWQDFVNFLIRFFLYILPVLITIAIPIFLVLMLLRWIFRITRRPKVAQTEEIKK